MAFTASDPDAELRTLWAKYLDAYAAEQAAHDAVPSAKAAFDAEFADVRPVHMRAFLDLRGGWIALERVWAKYGLESLSDR